MYVVTNVDSFSWPKREEDVANVKVGVPSPSGGIPCTSSAPFRYEPREGLADVTVDRPLYVRCVVPLALDDGTVFVPSGVSLACNGGVYSSMSAALDGGSGVSGFPDTGDVSFASVPYGVVNGSLVFYVPSGSVADVQIRGKWEGPSVPSGSNGSDVLAAHVSTVSAGIGASSVYASVVGSSLFGTQSRSGETVASAAAGIVMPTAGGEGVLVVSQGVDDYGYKDGVTGKRVRGKVTLMIPESVLLSVFSYWSVDIRDFSGNLYRHFEGTRDSGDGQQEGSLKDMVFDDFPCDASLHLTIGLKYSELFNSSVPFNRTPVLYEKLSYIDYADENGEKIEYGSGRFLDPSEFNDADDGEIVTEIDIDRLLNTVEPGIVEYRFVFEKIKKYEYYFFADDEFCYYVPSFTIRVLQAGYPFGSWAGSLTDRKPYFFYATDEDLGGILDYQFSGRLLPDEDGCYVNVTTSDGLMDFSSSPKNVFMDVNGQYINAEVHDKAEGVNCVVFTAVLRNGKDDSLVGCDEVDFSHLAGNWTYGSDMIWTFTGLVRDDTLTSFTVDGNQSVDPSVFESVKGFSDRYTCELEIRQSGRRGQIYGRFRCTLSGERTMTLMLLDDDGGIALDDNGKPVVGTVNAVLEKCSGNELNLKVRGINLDGDLKGLFTRKMKLEKNGK